LLIAANAIFGSHETGCNDISIYDSTQNWHTFIKGRFALQFAISELIDSPTPQILVPALYCQSALENCAGVEFTFYDDTGTGDIDLIGLKTHLAKGTFDAIIVNHLFGQTPTGRDELYRSCRDQGVLMIDDMCHCPASLLSRDNNEVLDNYDVRLFSFRKFLPVPALGAVQINSRFGVKMPTRQITIPLSAKIKFAIEKFIFTLGWRWLWHLAIAGRTKWISLGSWSSHTELQTASAGKLPHQLVAMIADRQKMRILGNRRRVNFDRLAKIIIPFTNRMKPNDTPQVFAVRDRDGRIAHAMHAGGVTCFNWPAAELPQVVRDQSDKFPNAVELADEILCIPVHQDITTQKCEYIAIILSEILKVPNK